MDVFIWEPNENAPIVERYQYLTDIQTSYNGYEQRYALRQEPVQSITYEVMATKVDSQKIVNFVRKNQGKIVKVPYWLGGFGRLSTFSPNQEVYDEIGLRPTNLGFLTGTEACIFYKSKDDYSVRDVSQASNVRLTTTAPSASEAPLGTMIYPLREAYCPGAVQVVMATGSFVHMTVTFEFLQCNRTAERSQLTEWDSRDVFMKSPNRVQDLTDDISRLMMEKDFQTGKRIIHDQSNMSFSLYSHEHFFANRSDKHEFMEWMTKIRGNFKDFYVPTWQCDIEYISLDRAFNARGIVYVDNGYKDLSETERPEDLIFLGDWNGADYIDDRRMRRVDVLSAVPLGPTLRFTDTSDLNYIENFTSKISYLRRVRLNSDVIEFTHLNREVSTVILPLKTVRVLP